VRNVSALALVLLALSWMFAPLAGARSEEVLRAPSGVMYVTGGIGSDAVDRLKSMEKDFNLKLVFANKSGAYLSDIRVAIVDASGRVVLDTTSDGPVVMAKLPAGNYRIDATFGGHPDSRKITVAASRLTTLNFRWSPS
jgi:hypothetical protein